MLIAILVAALWLMSGRSAGTATTASKAFPCSDPATTKVQIAAYRGITVEMLDELNVERGLSPQEVCELKPDRLARAISLVEEPEEDSPSEALDWRLERQRDEKGNIPIDARSRAIQHAKQMPQQPKTQSGGIYPGSWSSVGPGNIGGRSRTLAIHPTTPNTMWLGSVTGGIWKTTDGGQNWIAQTDLSPNLAISSIVLDPTNPNTLYAATGEGFYNFDGVRGEGIFKTTNGGTTWTQLTSTATTDFLYVQRLSITADASVILAATRTGIFRSTNGGTSWTAALSLSDGITFAYDVDFDPDDSTKAVASGNYGKVWYSSDSGASWTLTPVTWDTTNRLTRVEVTHAKASVNTVFASVNQNSGEIWRSTDGGASFTKATTTNSNYLGGQGWYDNIIWVDPFDSNFLIVGGIDLWKSTNGGATLTKISQWQAAPASAHADNHFIISPPDYNGTSNKTVFFTNDGGIYKAADVKTVSNTSGWTELNNGLAITQFYGGAGNPTSGTIVGGTQDNGSLVYKGNSENWTAMFGGDGGYSAADQTDPNYFYGEYVYATVHRSNNGGTSSSYIYTGIADANVSSRSNFISPFILDPNNADTMLVGGASLWRSTNVKASTPSWSAIKAPTNTNNCINNAPRTCISAIAVAPGNSNIIWVGHNNGDVFFTTNGLAASPTWTQVDTGLPDLFVTSLAIDPANSSKVYVSLGGYSGLAGTGYSGNNLWVTSNNGGVWSDATGGSGASSLPSAPIYSVVLHPVVPNWIYVGTEVGVFASDDGGATWKTGPNDGPANVSVDELFFMNTTLVAATHGRGMFKAEVPGNFPILKRTATNVVEQAGTINGIIEPGDTVSVTIGLRNDGPQDATAISSSLIVTSSNASVLVGSSPYPNIVKYGGTGINTTTYQVQINPTASCGTKVFLSQTITYNTGLTSTYNFVVPTGQVVLGAPVTTNYTGPSVTVPDDGVNGVDVPLTLSGAGNVGDINVSLDMTHTYDGDMVISLVSPGGKQIPLSLQRGGNGANFVGTIFDDEAATSIATGSAPFTGSYRPEEPLSGFDGDPIAGIWKLRLFDAGPGDVGTLTAWSLTVQQQNFTCTPVTGTVTGGFHPLPQFRLYDSRTAFGGPGPFASGETRTITAVNNTGISSNPTSTVTIPASAKSVVVNFTAVQVSKGGFLTAYQTGITRPVISTLNWYYANQIVANSAIVDLNSAGQFDLYYGASTGDLTVDVIGYIDNVVDGPAIPASNPLSGVLTTTALTYKPVSSVLTSVRAYDSRPAFGGPGPLATGLTRTVPIRNQAGVPSTARVVIINLTAVNAVNRGYLAAYPGTSNPGTASVSFKGDVQPVVGNLVVVYLDSVGAITVLAGGTSTSADFVIDVFGYYDASDLATGGYVGLPAPVRHYDSRISQGGSGPITTGTTITAQPSVKFGTSTPTGVPANARAVVIHLAVANTVSNGFLALYGQSYQGTSSLNWAGNGQLVSNLAVVDLAQLDTLRLRAGGNPAAQTDFIIDIVGYIP